MGPKGHWVWADSLALNERTAGAAAEVSFAFLKWSLF